MSEHKSYVKYSVDKQTTDGSAGPAVWTVKSADKPMMKNV